MNKEELIEWGKNVGGESRKSFEDKLNSGFFDKYMQGKGLDLGGKGYLDNVHAILPNAQIVDLDYPGYDGKILPFLSDSQDYVYSSHCLEHIVDYKLAIQEWFRVTKVGGHIIIVVPHQFLYEKKLNLPSKWNGEHCRFYTASRICKEIEEALVPNSFRIRHLLENDKGHDYKDILGHGTWLYEIEIVLEKINNNPYVFKD